MCLPHFVYPWTLRLFLPLAIVNGSVMNIGVQISVSVSAFNSLDILTSGISETVRE